MQAVGIARAAGGHGYWIAMVPSGPPLPANSGSGRRIVYSNSQQRIWLVEANGQVSHSYLVSGRHGLPAVGTYQVFSKVTSSYSGDLLLPWTLRFAHGSSGAPIDFHGIPLRYDGSADRARFAARHTAVARLRAHEAVRGRVPVELVVRRHHRRRHRRGLLTTVS